MVRYNNWWKDPDTDRWFTHFFDYVSQHFDETSKSTLLNKINLVSVFGNGSMAPNPNDIRIFFTGENLKRPHYASYDNNKSLSQKYDLVLGFRDKPENLANVVRFPLWCIYIPFYKDCNRLIEEIEKECSTAYQRKNSAIIVCSHDRSGIRKKCVDACSSKGISVDVSGNWSYPGCNKIFLPRGVGPKLNLLKCYAINICPENSHDNGYTTEKVFHALQSGCLPVYDGCNPVESKVLNQSRVVFLNDMSNLTSTQLIEKTKLTPFTKNAKFWFMKYYLDVWSKVWYIGHKKGIRYNFNGNVMNANVNVNLVHNYFIIPYRNREAHFKRWIEEAKKTYKNKPFKFSVILVEQKDDKAFNRGRLLNSGFWKAMEVHHKTYGTLLNPRPNLIFSDVDVFCNDLTFFRPEPYVYHPYGHAHGLGCIFVSSPEAYLSINGFSNNYYGWGREDADATLRCKIQGILIKSERYQHRNRSKFFIEFPHPSNATKVQKNYEEYNKLSNDNTLLHASGVNDEDLIQKTLDATCVNPINSSEYGFDVHHIFLKP
jgi:hypothetical protein